MVVVRFESLQTRSFWPTITYLITYLLTHAKVCALAMEGDLTFLD